MLTRKWIYIAAAAAGLIILGIAAGSAWSDRRIERAERAAKAAVETARESEKRAGEKEADAAQYKAKTEYLEQQLAGISAIAGRQDDELEKLEIDTGAARDNVRGSRSIRAAAADADELCRRLAELGHGC